MGSQVTQGELTKSSSYPFNTPLESGFRTLTLLAALAPAKCDLQRLVYYDYFLVHSKDIPNSPDAPENIHPATPYRSSEVVVRRDLIEKGCHLMLSRELLSVEYTSEGIYYKSSEITEAFLSYFETPYYSQLRTVAAFVADRLATLNDDDLSNFISGSLGRWGTEFERESILQEAV